MTNSPPKLKVGQVSVICADRNTGQVLKTNNELYHGQGNIVEIFDSFELAELFIKEQLTKTADIEFVVYNNNADPILIWDKKERRQLG